MENIPREIISQAAAGGMEAFERIYRAASSFVYNVALRITNNPHDAQEVTQDVFMRVYRSLKEFEFRSSFKTWLYRVTVNTAINRYNRTAKDTVRRVDLEDVPEARSPGPDVRQELAAREEQDDAGRRVREMLEVLNPDQRACVVLREIEGLSYHEIAAALHTNINTVRSRLKRAREALVAYARGGGK